MSSRIDIFKQMLVSDPVNSSILFGLAKEYEKAGQTEDMIEVLERYLAISDDEGNGSEGSPQGQPRRPGQGQDGQSPSVGMATRASSAANASTATSSRNPSRCPTW